MLVAFLLSPNTTRLLCTRGWLTGMYLSVSVLLIAFEAKGGKESLSNGTGLYYTTLVELTYESRA